ncbi:hypothetical protein VPH35_138292 [Triticum aestivum]
MSMHSTWNKCLHAGSCRTISPPWMSSRQTGHITQLRAASSPSLSPASSGHTYANAGGASATCAREHRPGARGRPADLAVRASTGLTGLPVRRRTHDVLGVKQPRMTSSDATAAAKAPAIQAPTVTPSTQKRRMATQATAMP